MVNNRKGGEEASLASNIDTATADTEVLGIGEEGRYDRLQLIGWWDQSRLQRSQVMVVGAGALGNEVIKNLALVGVGRILILDFDLIERTNLSRAVLFRERHCGLGKAEVAAAMARELNPDCTIVGRQADVVYDIGLGVVASMDVVICCVDNREARLWINRMCWKTGVPWVDGGIQEISGVAKTFVPPDGGCYECTMTENDYRMLQLRYSCPLLRREDIQEGKVPTAPTIAALIGALQSQEALKILHGRQVGAGMGWVFNGDANRFYGTEYPVREDCLSHEYYTNIQGVPLSALVNTAEDLMKAVALEFNKSVDAIELDRDVLLELVCDQCERRDPQIGPLNRVTLREAACPICHSLRRPETTCIVPFGSELSRHRLVELGVPAFDVVKVKSGDETVWIRLDGDADSLWQVPALTGLSAEVPSDACSDEADDGR